MPSTKDVDRNEFEMQKNRLLQGARNLALKLYYAEKRLKLTPLEQVNKINKGEEISISRRKHSQEITKLQSTTAALFQDIHNVNSLSDLTKLSDKYREVFNSLSNSMENSAILHKHERSENERRWDSKSSDELMQIDYYDSPLDPNPQLVINASKEKIANAEINLKKAERMSNLATLVGDLDPVKHSEILAVELLRNVELNDARAELNGLEKLAAQLDPKLESNLQSTKKTIKEQLQSVKNVIDTKHQEQENPPANESDSDNDNLGM